MSQFRILGIHLTDRVKDVAGIQYILSKYGCSIRTRIGLNEVKDNYCTKDGLILLELTGDNEECLKLENELLGLDGVTIRKMIF